PDQVVQAPLTGGYDVHPGALADGFKAFEDGDGRRAVVVLLSGHGPRYLLACCQCPVMRGCAAEPATAGQQERSPGRLRTPVGRNDCGSARGPTEPRCP